MPTSKHRRGRKPYSRDVRVTVCGAQISTSPDLICLLPSTSKAPHTTHTTLALAVDDNILYLVFRDDDSKEITCRPVEKEEVAE